MAINVKEYGAVGDGTTDDRAAITSALLAAAANGGDSVYFPPGTYNVSRNGTNSWSLDLPGSNIMLSGVRGKSWLRHPTGMPAASVCILRVDGKNNVVIRELGFDGNWGNAVTTISSSSDGVSLPTGTINVVSTAGFPSSGTVTLVNYAGSQSITYTGTTATTFTGCTGGTGVIAIGNRVGYIDSQAGINHSTQADPQNYAIMLRGSTNVTIDDCAIQNTYGDGIWIGASSADFTLGCNGVIVSSTAISLSARDGIALAQKCEQVRVRDCLVTNIYGQALDFEPVGAAQYVRDVVIDGCLLDGWFNPSNPARTSNAPVSIEGGGGAGGTTSQAQFARSVRLVNSKINGPINVTGAYDISIDKCRIVCDWTGYSYAPINIYGFVDGIAVTGCDIYARTSFGVSNPLNLISIAYYAVAFNNWQPQGVVVHGNRLHARNGASGIAVNGSGGQDFNNVEVPGATGTSTSTSSTSLIDSTKSWTFTPTNQWVGYMVVTGGVTGYITGNTATTLSVTWIEPSGDTAATPATGTYTIVSAYGFVGLYDNVIDCDNDGAGQGANGIIVQADRAGMRMSIRNNNIRNATGDAIHVNATSRTVDFLEIVNNNARDTQVVKTCINHVGFVTPSNITKLVFSGNVQDTTITPSSGIPATPGVYWYEADGVAPRFAGYGVPNGVITAPIGASYTRLEGGIGRTLWIKEAQAGFNTGWGYCSRPSSPAWTVDSGSGIACPATATEWTSLLTAAGISGSVSGPDMFWLCQEASGNLADSSGNGYTLTAGGTVAYHNSVLGWSRLGVGTNDNVNGQWQSTAATLPDVSIGAMTLIQFASVASTANVNRSLGMFGTGATSAAVAYIGGAASTRVTSGTNVTTAAGTQAGPVLPYGLVHNAPGSTTFGFDDQNRLNPGFASTVTGKSVLLGGLGGVINPMQSYKVYAFAWKSAISAANLKTLLTFMGWNITWI